MNLKERLTIEFGDDCFVDVSPDLALENEFRVSAMWRHLGEQLDAELPARSRPVVIRTTRAFPHTRWTSRSVTVVFDQHLIDIFDAMTRPIVMPACPQELAATYVMLILSERLWLAGRGAAANVFSGIFNIAQRDFRDIIGAPVYPKAWQSGEALVRGQWFFTVGHELVHAILHHANFLDRLDGELSDVQSDLMAELKNFAGDSRDDPLRREPILRFFAHTHGIRDEDLSGAVSALTEMVADRLSEPRFRLEVICDWLAARATATEMLRFAPQPIGLATCGLALVHLATIKQLDSYSQGSAPPVRDHLGEGALRLVILRSLLFVRPPAAGGSGFLLSRAFGDVTSAYLETYASALRMDWRLVIEAIDEPGSRNAH